MNAQSLNGTQDRTVSSTASGAPNGTTRLLIVNADDFGQTSGITQGIIMAHEFGIVRSTTLLANGIAFDLAVTLASRFPTLGIGLHVNFVEGQPIAPVSQVASLVNSEGQFLGKRQLISRCLRRQIVPEHVRCEFAAQVKRLRQAGLEPTHFDSHQHLHVLPGLSQAVLNEAENLGISACRWPSEPWTGNLEVTQLAGFARLSAVRLAARYSRQYLQRTNLRTTSEFAGICVTGSLSADWIARWLTRKHGVSVELMVHPGYCDDTLRTSGTRLLQQREFELTTMLDTRLPTLLQNHGFELGNYRDLLNWGAKG